MTALQLDDALHHQPFEPFRLVMTEGVGYDISHPDLVMVGLTAAVVGLTGEMGQRFFERTVKIDLNHVIRLEPIDKAQSVRTNGPPGTSVP